MVDELPHGKSTWVLSYKSHKNGQITKMKPRLVAKEFMQREGLIYLRRSVPTPAAASVKSMMAVVKELQYKVYHLDVAQALTKATLDYEVYVKLLGGCGDLSGKYVRLEKALYRLKQSGLLWNDLLVVKLITVHGMEQCKSDPCVFRLILEGKTVRILTYM